MLYEERLTMNVRWLPMVRMMLLMPALTVLSLCAWSQAPVVSANEIVVRMQRAKASYRGRGIP